MLSAAALRRARRTRATADGSTAASAAPPATKLKFSIHLTVCSVCQRMRSQLQTTRAVLRALPPASAKTSEVDAILELLAKAPLDEADDDHT